MNTSGWRGREQRRRPISEINVVPYIDVTLVLLIIFMVTAPMLQTGVEVDLPQAEAKSLDASKELPIVVTVDAAGQLFVDVGNRGDRPVSQDQLAVEVGKVLQKSPGLSVLIRGDQAVDYGRVIAVMASLKTAGVSNVGLMTRPVEE